MPGEPEPGRATAQRCFIDTNVVVYANDTIDPAKQNRAIALITDLALAGNGVLSAQVLHEYAATAIRKLNNRARTSRRRSPISRAWWKW